MMSLTPDISHLLQKKIDRTLYIRCNTNMFLQQEGHNSFVGESSLDLRMNCLPLITGLAGGCCSQSQSMVTTRLADVVHPFATYFDSMAQAIPLCEKSTAGAGSLVTIQQLQCAFKRITASGKIMDHAQQAYSQQTSNVGGHFGKESRIDIAAETATTPHSSVAALPAPVAQSMCESLELVRAVIAICLQRQESQPEAREGGTLGKTIKVRPL